MSTLVLLLPAQTISASSSLEYVLMDAARTVLSHGSSPLPLLPAPSGADASVVAVVPASAVSWQRLELPKGAPTQGAKLRSVLEGALEDHLLDELEDLHFALEPGARPGVTARVAVCHKAWLQAALAALEDAGRPVSRIVPQFAPDADSAWVFGDPHAPLCALSEPDQVLCLPLAVAVQRLQAADSEPRSVHAEPAVAQAAELAWGRAIPILPRAQQLAQAATGAWDFAQFELAQRGGQRLLRRIGESMGRFGLAPQWRAARWACVGLVCVNLLGLQAAAWRERKAVAERQQAVVAVLQQTFPQVKLVVDAPVQMSREVAALRQATGALSAGDAESMLGTLALLAPGARLDAVEYRRGEMRLRGSGLETLGDAATGLRLQATGLHARADGGVWVLREARDAGGAK